MSWTRESRSAVLRARAFPGLRALALVFCASVPLPAFAQAHAGDAAMAETLFNDAKRRMSLGDFAGACPKLAESYRLDPGSGTLTALAVCHESLGKTASAWTEFIEVVNDARQAGRADRQKFAQQHIDALEPKLSRLTVAVDPAIAGLPGLEVRRDGTLLGSAGWGTAAPVDPGSHTVEVKVAGKKTWFATVSVGTPGDQRTVTVPPLENAPAPSAPPEALAAPSSSGPLPPGLGAAAPVEEAAPAEQPPPQANVTQRTVAYVVGGAGLIAGAFGTYFGVEAISKAHDANGQCSSSPCGNQDAVNTNNDAKSAAVMANVLFGGAVVAVGVGAVLLLTAPSQSPSPPASTGAGMRVVPVASTRGASLVLDGRW
jgi:hypothetical protein